MVIVMNNDREELYQRILSYLGKNNTFESSIVFKGHWENTDGTQSINFDYNKKNNSFKLTIESLERVHFKIEDECSFEEIMTELRNFIYNNFTQLYCRRFLDCLSIDEI